MNQTVTQLRGRLWSGNRPANEIEARKRIIDAFLELAQGQGYEKVSMSGVASAAGITRPTLYKYFNNISDLYFASVQSVFEASAMKLTEQLERYESLESQLTQSLLMLNAESSKDELYANFLRGIITSEMVRQLPLEDREQAQIPLLAIALEPIFAKHPAARRKRAEISALYARLAISVLFVPFADEASIRKLVRMLLKGIE